jgi:sulfide:quinone oxidoreductase
VGGTIVANILARKRWPRGVEITVVDRTGDHVYQPGFMYVAFDGMSPSRLVRKERTLLSKKVNLVTGEATKIDPARREVALADGRSLPYDRLVIALGARFVPDEVPGFKEAAHHFYGLNCALLLRDELARFRGGKVVVGVASVPYKCPPAPAEAACQLDHYFAKKGIRDKVEIHFLSPIGRVFPIEALNPEVEKIFEERGIASHTFFNVESIDPEKKVVSSLEGESIGFDLLVMVPPHRGPKVVEDSGLGDRGGWLTVDRGTLRHTSHPEIFGMGDCTNLPVSKSGAAAHYQAKAVADQVFADLDGGASESRYDGKVVCFFDAGRHQAFGIHFDYDHPPKLEHLNFKDWLEKHLLNWAYWRLVPTGLV